MKKNKIEILFLVYILISILFNFHFYVKEYVHDDNNYIEYAERILNFKIFDTQNPYFWCGPGYPLLVTPFIHLFKHPKLPLVALNYIFHFLSVFLLFKSFKTIASRKASILLTLPLALYYPAFQELLHVVTEPFAIFLFSVFIYTIAKNKLEHRNVNLLIAGLLFGYICLIKVIFGYVQLVTLIITSIWYLIFKIPTIKNYIKIGVYSYLITIPYLLFTYSTTQKPFFWANSGGENLYWMSTPYPNELGNWYIKDYFINQEFRKPYDTLVYFNHKNFLLEVISENNHIKRDEMFKQKAISNIKSYPFKYAQNIVFNASRLYFNFPHTAVLQSKNNTFRIFINSFFFVFAVIAFVYFIYNYKSIDDHIKFLYLIFLIYMALTCLVSALPRQLNVTILYQTFIYGYLTVHFKKHYLK